MLAAPSSTPLGIVFAVALILVFGVIALGTTAAVIRLVARTGTGDRA